LSVCLMNYNAKVGSISQAAAFNVNAKMPPDTLTRGFAWSLVRPRPPYRLALKVRFAGRFKAIMHQIRFRLGLRPKRR